MKRNMRVALLALALVPAGVGAQAQGSAQTGAAGAADSSAAQVPRAHVRNRLAGPRFGFTVFTGKVAELRQQAGKEPLMSQFGWQFETQIASRSNGNQALMEWVMLVGGVEQNELNFSLSWLTGYRMENGFELGAGPAVSVSKDNTKPRTSMIAAGGAKVPFGDLYVPLHMAVAFAEGGPRLTTLVGWIID